MNYKLRIMALLLLENFYKNYTSNIMKTLLFILLLCGCLIRVAAQEIEFVNIESEYDWNTVREKAKTSGKYIFLDIFAYWCGPCNKMNTEVYNDPVVKAMFEKNFINAKVNGESYIGVDLAEKFVLSAYPFLVFADGNESVIYRQAGYQDSPTLMNTGNLVLENGKRLLELEAQNTYGLATPADVDEYISLLSKMGNMYKLAPIAQARVPLFGDREITDPKNKQLIIAAKGKLESSEVQAVIRNAAAVREAWGEADYLAYLAEVFNSSMADAGMHSDTAALARIEKQLIPAYMVADPSRIPEGILETRKLYYSHQGDYPKYLGVIEDYYAIYHPDSVDFRYGEAYYIVQNELFEPSLLEKANEWIEMVVKARPDFNSYFLATLINAYRRDEANTNRYLELASAAAKTPEEKQSVQDVRNSLEGQ